MDKINALKELLVSSNKESDIEEISILYSDDVVEYGDFPVQYAALLVDM